MRRVLVAHIDCAVGRRLAKALYHDPEVALVVGVGTGPAPSFLDVYRGKCFYQRLDLAKARHLTSFFHSERFARARLDSVILLPFGSDPDGTHIPGNVPSLVSETRRLLEGCKGHAAIERFILLSSVFVYSPVPASASVCSEDRELSFDAAGNVHVRSWIDADLLCQNELKDPHLKMTILRSATIVTEAGELLHCPPLESGPIPLGYDPMLQLVSDRDVARALVLALHADRPGAYNVASRELFPCSEFPSRRSRSGLLPVPERLRAAYRLLQQALGRGHPSAFQRHGVVLDTSRARERLGFEPQYRVELRGRGPTRHLDTVRCR